MKKKKGILIIGLIIIFAIITGVFLYQRMFTASQEDTVEKGQFIEIPNSNEEVKITDITRASVGDNVILGDYEEEITWNVLDERKDSLLLISTNCIAQRAYHNEDTAVTWEESEIRKWLNETFYDKAFSEDDKAILLKTKVSNQDNEEFDTKAGKDTNDYVFLLSLAEADQYFSETSERAASLADGTGVWWWLRSPGFQENDAANVGDYGSINKAGHKVYDKYVVNGGVRPVIWIRKNK